jgi:MtN3 and saliva related transmembrane protein
MSHVEIIGLLAGLLTTVAFVPQALQIYRTKSARDISLRMFVAFTIGIVLWTVFGILKRDLAITLWNSVTLVLAIWILVMKLRYDR